MDELLKKLNLYKQNIERLRKVFMDNDGKINETEDAQLKVIQQKIDAIEQAINASKTGKKTLQVPTANFKADRKAQFTVDPKKPWSYEDFKTQRKEVKVDKASMSEEEKTYFKTYQDVAENYMKQQLDKYEPDHTSLVTSKMIADAALKTYMKYGDINKVAPLDLALAQLRFETFYGSRGDRKGSKVSPFNVGVWDDDDAPYVKALRKKWDTLKTDEERSKLVALGIELYFDKMAQDYFSTKTPEMLKRNFTNENEQRYATDKLYEQKISKASKAVSDYAKTTKTGMPNDKGLDDVYEEGPPIVDPVVPVNGKIKVPKGWGLDKILKTYNITLEQLKAWNPTYTITKKGFNVGDEIVVGSGKPNIEGDTPTPTNGTITVKAKETLYSLSKTHKVSVEDLKAWNKLTSDAISEGQQLYIQNPNGTTIVTPTNGTIIVKAKETLYSLSKTHGVSVEDLKTWNKLTSDAISEGQQLYIQNPTGTTTVTPTTGTIIVKEKETLYSLSKTYGVSVEDLKRWNNLSSDSIKKGQQLYITAPKGQTPSETTITVTGEHTLYSLTRTYGVSEEDLKRWNPHAFKNGVLQKGATLTIKK